MNDQPDPKAAKIAIVGPCASGKSTLAERLNQAGWRARQIVQEHSYVPAMWRTISPPDILIYLDASYETCSRRKQLDWSHDEYSEQVERLADARKRCDLYLNSDQLTIDETAQRVMDWLRGRHDHAEAL
jgi:shikimate kinase